ncbi:MAG: hypothetical protein ABSF43_11405 [Rectinemataceae bacterium]|jgi:hypothetical protein
MFDEIPNTIDLPDLARERDEPQPAPSPEVGKRVRRRELLNRLNFINFSEGTIFASFRHLERGDRITFQAFPRPCLDDVLDCRWLPPGISMSRLRPYVCDSFLLSDGHSHVTVKAEVTRLDADGITFKIPESGYEKSSRMVERHACEKIDARLIQGGLSFTGRLLDFNALSFRVELEAPSSGSLGWINPASPVTALFSRGEEVLYSGECLISRMDRGRAKRELVLVPNFNNIRRYKPRVYRSQRQVLSPRPAVQFQHPFTGKRVFLQVKDISGTGICVEEFFERSFLLPGMVLAELSVEIANHFVLKCRAQVLYRNVISGENGDNTVRCGIVLLDMDIQDQAKLSAFLHQAVNERLRICGSVDMEELWRFFFETGFIYPSKYLSIEARKEEFKRTYEKLYLDSPSIARHFLFQDKGQIFGHMSMLRYYSNSWIIHHHAASRDGYGMAGVGVLDQVGRYGNEFYHHPSSHMDFLICYYRKENRFPNRVFGNVVRDIADPKGSSVDGFAYLRLPAESEDEGLPFQLFPARAEDYTELRRYYEGVSGGLALDALDLTAEGDKDGALDQEYSRQGFKRERHVFCLRQEGRLAAVMTLTLSDLGLNLSNLTNCVHVMVLDGERLRPATLFSGLRNLLRNYGAEDIPILAYPADFLDGHAVPYEKKYLLWVLDMDRADAYFSSLRNTFRRNCRDGNDGHHDD